MNKLKPTTLSLLAVSAFFLLTRILALQIAGSYWFDEAFSVHFAQMPFWQMWGFLQFEHNPLVHFVALKGWMELFGTSEIATRSLSVLAGLGSLFLIYHLGKKLFNQKAGLYAMVLMTLSPMFLYHQTEARMYSLVIFFSLLTLLSFWEWTNSKNNWWLALYTLSAILLVHTHLTTWSLLIALWVIFFIEKNNDKKKWALANLLVLGTFLLWFIPVLLNRLSIGNIEQGWFFFQHAQSFWLDHITNFFLNGETGLWIRSIGALLLFVLFALAFIKIERPGWWQKIRSLLDQERWPLSLVALWDKPRRLLLFAFLIPLLIGFALQVTVAKYLLVAALPFFLLIGQGIASRKSVLARALIVGILILLVLPMQLRLLFEQRHHWDDAATLLQSYQQEYPDAVFISHTFAWALPLEFYGLDDDLIKPFYPLDDDLSFDERLVRYNWQPIVNRDNVQALSEVVSSSGEVVLISSTPERGSEDPVKEWFAQSGWQLIDQHRFPGYGDPELLIYQRSD